jgi:hypothetical protein
LISVNKYLPSIFDKSNNYTKLQIFSNHVVFLYHFAFFFFCKSKKLFYQLIKTVIFIFNLFYKKYVRNSNNLKLNKFEFN